jgi:AcrR family transcriptional regulator
VTITSARTRRDATENRAALILAARVMLNRDPESSLEAIAAEAGLSRRSVYGHFANRDELLRELVLTGALRVATALDSISHPEPAVRLALIAAHLWKESDEIRVMAVIAVRSPLKRYTDDALRHLRATVLATVEAGRDAGVVRTDIPAARLARLAEDGLLTVLEESTRAPLTNEEGHRLAMQMILSTIGFGWREANEFVDSHDVLALEHIHPLTEKAGE